MNILPAITAIFTIIAVTVFGAEHPSFDDFKSLSANERRALIDKADGKQKLALLDLDDRVRICELIGKDDWRQLLETEVIAVRGFSSLFDLFVTQRDIHIAYILAEYKAEEARGGDGREKELVLSKQEEVVHKTFKSAFKMLVYLAPTEEARRLNEAADEMRKQLDDRFPLETGLRVTERDLTEVDRSVAKLLSKIEKLPRLNEHELEAELKPLPEKMKMPRVPGLLP